MNCCRLLRLCSPTVPSAPMRGDARGLFEGELRPELSSEIGAAREARDPRAVLSA